LIIAVTGASGHVGANLVRSLISAGNKVRVLINRDSRAIEGLDPEIFSGSILDKNVLRDLIEGSEIVFHLAALISITNNEATRIASINTEGTKNVCDVCLEKNVRRLVHFSSIHAFSPFPLNEPTDETRALLKDDERFPYDRSKADAERIVSEAVQHGLDAIILNPTAIIGPFDFRPSLTGRMMISILKQRLLALVNGGFNWVDVRDIAEGAIKAALNGKKGEKYILAGNWHTIKELALMLKSVSGCVIPRFVSPMWLARLGAPVMGCISNLTGKTPLYTAGSLTALRQHRTINGNKAKTTFGFSSRTTFETIKDTFNWFNDSGYLDP
jgi:dihydroflavonol-4-reductase